MGHPKISRPRPRRRRKPAGRLKKRSRVREPARSCGKSGSLTMTHYLHCSSYLNETWRGRASVKKADTGPTQAPTSHCEPRRIAPHSGPDTRKTMRSRDFSILVSSAVRVRGAAPPRMPKRIRTGYIEVMILYVYKSILCLYLFFPKH